MDSGWSTAGAGWAESRMGMTAKDISTEMRMKASKPCGSVTPSSSEPSATPPSITTM